MLLTILYNQELLYRGEDAVNVFCNNLNEMDNSACRWYFLSRQPNKAWWPGLLKTSAKACVAVLDF